MRADARLSRDLQQEGRIDSGKCLGGGASRLDPVAARESEQCLGRPTPTRLAQGLRRRRLYGGHTVERAHERVPGFPGPSRPSASALAVRTAAAGSRRRSSIGFASPAFPSRPTTSTAPARTAGSELSVRSSRRGTAVGPRSSNARPVTARGTRAGEGR
jgi:hypothetical protein